MALPLVPFLLYALALRGSGAAAEETGRPGPHRASAPSGLACPLPVGRQVQAVRAFEAMLPVFRHPRCFNCHGGFDPMAETHEGFRQARGSGLNPLTGVLTVEERLRFHSDCGSCHDNISGQGLRPRSEDTVVVSGWMLAPQPMQWVGESDEGLCRLVKRFERDGDQFVDHVLRDHGEVDFIGVAFRGDRALGFDSAGLVDDLHRPAEPPPGDAAQLVAQARRWVRLMGAEAGWVGDPSCGCVAPGLKLQVDHRWVMDTPGGLPSRQATDAQFEVTLRPVGEDRPGFFQGEHALDRRIEMTLPAFCTGRAAVHERWQFHALVDSTSGDIRVWHVALPGEPTGQIECRMGGGTSREGLFPWASLLGAGEMVIPADTTRQRVEASMEGLRESLTITVVAEPPTD